VEDKLEADGHDVRMINAGVSGDTTAGGLARLEWALADEPDAAIVALGANDMLRGFEPEIARKNLDAIITRLKKDGVAVLLAGMRAAPNWGVAYVDEFNAIYPALAEKHDVLFYPFLLEGVAADPTLNQPDGIHPNAKGQAIIARQIYPFVKKLVERARDG
jgi:acyl-CoA thioesterase-1